MVTDLELDRASRAVAMLDQNRFVARCARRVRCRPRSPSARGRAIDVIVNACDPRLNPPIFAAAFDAGVTTSTWR